MHKSASNKLLLKDIVRLFLFSLALLQANLAIGQECVERRNVSILFIVDVSTSMAETDGGITKIEAAKQFGASVTNALSSSGISVEGAIMTFCGNFDGGDGFCYLTPTNNIGWTNAPNLVASFSGAFNLCDGTALNQAIIMGADNLRSRGGGNLKLLVLLTDGMDASACAVIASPSTALTGGDIVSRLIFIGSSGGSLPSIASGAGSTSQALNASASSLNSLVNNVLEATCVNHRPVSSFTKSDDNLRLGVDGFSINFDGSSSNDRETASSSLVYEWTFRRPDNTTYTRSGRSFNETFNDDQLSHGTNWQVSLRVQDARGIWSTNSATQNFTVTGSPPNITLTSSPASPFDANVTAAISASPENDIDGGALNFLWTITNSPVGAVLPSGPLNTRTFALSAVEQNITSFSNGTDFRTPWRFQCEATDDEGEHDTKNIEIHIRNLKPRIHITGPTEININEPISLQTDILVDDDGGDFTSFIWAIIQSPNSSMVGTPSNFATGSSMSMPTSAIHAGTWRFQLTVTDNEGEEATQDYTVLVDGPPDANISGPTTNIGSISGFPLTLDGAASVDPDTQDGCPNHCHTSSDGPVQGISPGIVRYTWYLLDAPEDNPNIFALGQVDDVLGINSNSSTLEIPFSKRLTPGYYTFQLKVEDGEGNTDTEDFVVDVTEEESKPFAFIIPPYEIQYVDPATNFLLGNISFNGNFSFDADNLLSSPISAGITNYEWFVLTSPPGCLLAPSLPSGNSATTATLFSAGTFIDPVCQGLWKVGLRVTDDDPIAKTNDPIAEATVVIGNCPSNLCVDYPTTVNPQIIQFSDATDVSIYFHLNSILYTNPAALFGTVAQLEIFYEAETTPFYTAFDPNLFPTDLGGYLWFQWNGYGVGNARPRAGHYHIKITLLDQSLGIILGGDDKVNAILIQVANPTIAATSDTYVDRDKLQSGTDNVTINYNIAGGGTPTALRWRVFDAGNSIVKQADIATPPISGTINWNGLNDAMNLVPIGDYEIELETMNGATSMGISSRYKFSILQCDIDADITRDGTIDNTTDELNENIATLAAGALFNVNYDRDGARTSGAIPIGDALNIDDSGVPGNEDMVIDNAADALDITPFTIRKIMNVIPASMHVFLKAGSLEDIQSIHVFKKILAGETAIWGGLGSRIGAPAMPTEIDITQWVNPASPNYQGDGAGNVTFGLEGLFFRNTGSINSFDGAVEFTLEIRDGATVVSSDVIAIKVAPWLMLSHTQASSEVWVEDHPFNVSMRLNASADVGYFGLDNSTQMQPISSAEAGSQWIQDHLEIGYYQRPGGAKEHCVFRLPYSHSPGSPQPIWPQLRLMSSSTGTFQVAQEIDPATGSGDYGGNLELLPPNAVNRNGKIVIGSRRSTGLFDFLTSQEAQQPFSVNTHWLAVGHVDEIFGFTGTPNEVIVADPLDAYAHMNAIPIANRGKSVFFSKGIIPVDGAVSSNSAVGNRINTGIDHTVGPAWRFIRIYRSTVSGAKGQIARIPPGGLQNGFILVDRVWNTGSTLLPLTGSNYGDFIHDATAPSSANWFNNPQMGDRYVLLEDTRFWETGTPSAITVEEVLADTELENLNKLDVQPEIEAIKMTMQTQNGLLMNFIKVPTIYMGDRAGFSISQSCEALTPGLANFQSVNDKFYFPRQFGPKNSLGEDIFEKVTLGRVPSALFTDDWDLYHAKMGEVHCGTNVKRVLPLFNWW